MITKDDEKQKLFSSYVNKNQDLIINIINEESDKIANSDRDEEEKGIITMAIGTALISCFVRYIKATGCTKETALKLFTSTCEKLNVE